MMKRIEKILEFSSVFLMGIMALVVTVQIVSRLLHYSLIWTEELSRYTLVYITFLGAALAYYKGDGLRITILIDRFSPRFRKMNDIIMLVLSIILTLFLVFASSRLVVEIWNIPTPALQWYKGMIILVVPIGFSLVLIKLFKDLKKILPVR
jgi:TRAP-type C4-dicarboxylate transport system permease small subunit